MDFYELWNYRWMHVSVTDLSQLAWYSVLFSMQSHALEQLST